MSTAATYWLFRTLCVIGLLLILKKPQQLAEDLSDDASQSPTPSLVWSQSLQWGYLLVLIGLFGSLSEFFSFSTILFILVLICGAGFIIDKFIAEPRRAPSALAPHFLHQTRDFFPMLCLIFLFRAFLFEPFQIPSSSMRPGLITGDFILVNKFTYGLRLPVLNTVFLPMNQVGRGDVAVFNYPENPSINYIKRIVGLPGDTVEYKQRQLFINGQAIEQTPAAAYAYQDQQEPITQTQLAEENMFGHRYLIANEIRSAAANTHYNPQAFGSGRYRMPEGCTYIAANLGFRCIVPQGHYFAMGDNRDNSADSRYWGFVPDQLMVGKAFLIWLNLGQLRRSGTLIQ
jgi:signal peptidase I